MRLLNRALRGLVRNAGLQALTAATVALIFLVVAALALIHQNLDQVIVNWKRQFRMIVVVEHGVPTDDLTTLQKELAALPGVECLEYIDSDAAMQSLADRLKASRTESGSNQERILDLLTRNPLPPSFRLQISPESQEPATLRLLARQAGALSGVAEVRYGDAWVSRFHSFFLLFKLVALMTCSLLFVATAFIISTQFNLALWIRRDEIDLMKLLGADEAFIKAPYLIEGALIGAAGAAVAVIILSGLYGLFLSQAGTEIESLLSEVHFLSARVAFGLIGLAVVLGTVGSLVSIRRLSP
ncbi:MAG: permease-like cell division protein FtsX [Pseudomonadota bacterium]